jgi:glucokinase
VYIAGGITPRLMSIIGPDGGVLLGAYLHRRSRYHAVRAAFPLHVITNDQVGLLGAKVFAMRQLAASSTA